MSLRKTPPDFHQKDRIVAEARRDRYEREKAYRARALKIHPWICARCGREFSGKKLQELTVHHKDHNHDNNPPDGGNWELLCLYCHENEHSRHEVAAAYGEAAPDREQPSATYRPFADLQNLLKKTKYQSRFTTACAFWVTSLFLGSGLNAIEFALTQSCRDLTYDSAPHI